MKKIISFSLAFFLFLKPFDKVLGADVTDLTYEVLNGKIVITDCDKEASGSLIVPNAIEGIGVNSIGPAAFFDCKNLTEVILPDSINKIGAFAFKYCSELVKVKMPDRLLRIEDYTFENCHKLESINIPSTLVYIGKSSFPYSNIKNLILPDSLEVIDSTAFRNCINLETVKFGSGLKEIKDWAFYCCDSINSIEFPSGLSFIGSYAFNRCRGLESVVFLNQNESITELIFSNKVFSSCYNLSSITLSDRLKSLPSGTFDKCLNLKYIRIPESIRELHNSAFQNCVKLKAIKFEGVAPTINGVFVDVPETAKIKANFGSNFGKSFGGLEVEISGYQDFSTAIKVINNTVEFTYIPPRMGNEAYSIQTSNDLKNWETVINSNIGLEDFLITENHKKKVLVPTGNIGIHWIQPWFNDDDWVDVEGGGIGYARSGNNVDQFDQFIALDLETEMYRKNSSAYIRIPFEVEDKDVYESLSLFARVDDGFVASLNGEWPLIKFNSEDTNLGEWNSEASESNSDSIAMRLIEYSLNSHIRALRNGTNYLCIHAMNKGSSGSDFLFSCELLGTRKSLPVDKTKISVPISGKSKYFRVIAE